MSSWREYYQEIFGFLLGYLVKIGQIVSVLVNLKIINFGKEYSDMDGVFLFFTDRRFAFPCWQVVFFRCSKIISKETIIKQIRHNIIFFLISYFLKYWSIIVLNLDNINQYSYFKHIFLVRSLRLKYKTTWNKTIRKIKKYSSVPHFAVRRVRSGSEAVKTGGKYRKICATKNFGGKWQIAGLSGC